MKKILYTSIALNILLVGFFIGKRVYYANSSKPAIEQEPFSSMWNRGRSDVFGVTKIDSGDIVFIGNSITEGFLVTEIFGQKAKNRGISANTSKQLLGRIDPIARAKPAKIIIEIGVNDLREGVPPDSVVKNIEDVVWKIKHLSPETEIVINSVFPASGKYLVLQPQIALVNERLASFCTEQSIQYLDVYARLYDGDGLNKKYTYDGLHLNSSGYKVWESMLWPFIKE